MIAGFEMELFAEGVVFGDLCGFERLVRVGELGGGVGQGGIEPELVEVVSEVVVLLDVAAAGAQAVRAHHELDAVHELEEADHFEALGGSAQLRIRLDVDDEPVEHGAEVLRVPPAVCIGLAEADAAEACDVNEEGQRFSHGEVRGGFPEARITKVKGLTTWEVHPQPSLGERVQRTQNQPAMQATLRQRERPAVAGEWLVEVLERGEREGGGHGGVGWVIERCGR
jgi:hypothetical protein